MMRVERGPVGRLEIPSVPPMGMDAEGGVNAWARVWSRRWTVLCVMVLCFVGAMLYAVTATPVYRSSSRLYIEPAEQSFNADSPETMQSKNYLDTQCEVLRSTPILMTALETPTVKDSVTLAASTDRLHTLKSALTAEVGKKDDLIEVAFESAHPEEATAIVDAVVQSYMDYQSKQKHTNATEVLKVLEHEKQQRETELQEKLKAMIAFKLANGTLSFQDDRGNIIVQRLVRLSEALTAAELQTMDAKAAYESAVQMTSDPAKLQLLVDADRRRGKFGDDREYEQLRTDLNNAEIRMAAMQRQFAPNHPQVQTLKVLVEKLKARLLDHNQRFAQGYLEAARQDLAVAQQKEASIRATFDAQRKEASELNSKAGEYAVLEADYQRAQRMNEALEGRIKDARMMRTAPSLNVTVLEPARAETSPVRPRKGMLLGMSLVLGLMLGIAAAFLQSWADGRIQSGEELRMVAGVPVLCAVPHILGRLTSSERGQKTHLDPMSDAAEAYRNVRTAVYFGLRQARARTLVVTSPTQGEGKSTLAANLAITMAQAGDRVLLIDADLRKPSLTRIFGLDEEHGLTHLLSGDETQDRAIQSTRVERLDVLACGPVPGNPAEVLNSQRFAALLNELSGQYDRILLDSPPVLPFADARILGSVCDATLMVLRVQKSTRRMFEDAHNSLLSVGASVLGVVVNDLPRSRDRSAYYGSSYSYETPQDEPMPAEHGLVVGGKA
ncbi:MAG: polysaccharide biosynthesis tyrosine autokinase [Phycisphaerales bacterium]|nr:polysaccharide biosynthesis tyrosine autokinase [Phycisphaerales bacterium]